jgi:hypothetical protein
LNSTKVLFATDVHVPWHDPHAVELSMLIGEDYKPDLRVAGSDGLDFYKLSRFSKDPMRGKGVTLQDEIYQWQTMEQAWNDACPSATVRYLLGNHEIRLRKYIWDQAPELASLEGLSFENVLGLDALGIEYDDFSVETNNQEIMIGTLAIKHGSAARKHSGWSVKAELENEFYSVNVLVGHSHRAGQVFVTTRRGLVQGVEGFCLCDLHPSYIVGGNPNWQQGITLANVTEHTVDFELIPFERASGYVRAFWRGKEYLVKEN